MKTIFPITLLIAVMFLSCKNNAKKDQNEIWKNEILQTEQEFVDMAAKEGIPAAFSEYAAPDVVISRGEALIKGKRALEIYYQNQYSSPEKITLTWKPDFVEVSSSGDLAYTYGSYLSVRTDTLGLKTSTSGIFHTVWKRQPNGKWRFVWD